MRVESSQRRAGNESHDPRDQTQTDTDQADDHYLSRRRRRLVELVVRGIRNLHVELPSASSASRYNLLGSVREYVWIGKKLSRFEFIFRAGTDPSHFAYSVQ